MKLSEKLVVFLLVLFGGLFPAAAQKVVMSGYVKEASSGEPLIGAVLLKIKV